jgi:enoyl-CoA hydratase/carnithine racemase
MAIISLDRPDKLNAINAEMVAELNQALDAAEARRWMLPRRTRPST